MYLARVEREDARSGGQKRKRLPSSAAIDRGLVPSIAPSPPKEIRKKQKKEKEAPSENPEKENSRLGTLTKRFLEIAAQQPSGILELNDIAAQLGPSFKRRLYDITCVLEGINLIEKQTKNIVLWKAGGPLTEDQKSKIGVLRREVDKVHQLEKKLDASIAAVQNAIDHYTSLPTCYVHHSDVRSVPYLSGEMILAVKAARGAEVAVDPAPGQHRMTLRSETEVDVYVLTTEEAVAAAAPHENGSTSHAMIGLHGMGEATAAIANGAAHMSTPTRRGAGASDGSRHGSHRSNSGDLASLVQIADAASNQAPLVLGVDSNKSSPTGGLMPPSPISPIRNPEGPFGVIPLGEETFSFNAPLFPPSPTRGSPMHKPIAGVISSMPTLGSTFATDDTSPGMINDKALGRTRATASSSNVPYKSEITTDTSPFKPIRRSTPWGIATPEVSSTGFDDFVDASSPTKPGSFALTPTASPEKRHFPIGGAFGAEHESQDAFSFFPESSIGLPSHSHR